MITKVDRTVSIRYLLVYISLTLSLFVVIPARSNAQPFIHKDSAALKKLVGQANLLRFQKPDSFLPFANALLSHVRQLRNKKTIAELLNLIGEFYRVSGDYPEALEKFVEARDLAGMAGEKFIQGQSIGFIGITYIALGEYAKAIQNLQQAYSITMRSPATEVPGFFLSNLGDAHDKMKDIDSALYYQRLAWEFVRRSSMKPGQAYVLGKMGVLHGKLKNVDSAFFYFGKGLETSNTDVLNTGRIYYYLAEFFRNLGYEDSARKYGRLSVDAGYSSKQRNMIVDAADLLYKNYLQNGDRDSAFYFLQLTTRLKDSLFGPERFRKMQVLAINEQESKFLAEKEQQELKSQLEKSQIRNRSRYRTIAFSVTIIFIALLAFFVWRNLKRQKKVNLTLREQQEKISAQNVELEKAMKELKSTQSQLIQSEKMASLGELTAGIAHEIQNPLNFVNNFSEVNRELIEEMNGQLAMGNLQSAKEIAGNILENEAKITHHGKRADAIVKSMLQHSRTGSAQKELADINQLAEEYSRLAYHGWRARDKFFNARLDMDLDPNIEKTELAIQEIGRVVLNLVNNAFYAVNTRVKMENDSYKPIVTVKTERSNDKIIVAIKDNGPGIPQGITDKIFQPFFTTKPTGQGTGLGLSLSYDIVKAHGGELKFETNESQGSIFIIQLPVV